jgi:hypothetical protein
MFAPNEPKTKWSFSAGHKIQIELNIPQRMFGSLVWCKVFSSLIDYRSESFDTWKKSCSWTCLADKSAQIARRRFEKKLKAEY